MPVIRRNHLDQSVERGWLLQTNADRPAIDYCEITRLVRLNWARLLSAAIGGSSYVYYDMEPSDFSAIRPVQFTMRQSLEGGTPRDK